MSKPLHQVTPSLPVLHLALPADKPVSRSRQAEIKSCLVSLAVHGLLLGVLACIWWDVQNLGLDESIYAVFDQAGAEPLPFASQDESAELSVLTLNKPVIASVDQALRPEDAQSVVEPLVAVSPAWESSDATSTSNDASSPHSTTGARGGGSPLAQRGGNVTGGRSGEVKSRLLKQFGGTLQTEAAVARGLEWLAKQQLKDGGWSFQGPYPDGANFENRVSATSMALLAFLGGGHTHKSGKYQRQIDHALHWLQDRQKNGGSFGANTPHHHAFYTHAQATIAFCEAYAMTEDRMLLPNCRSALEFATRSQGPLGGWRYEFRGDSDTSVTGWMVMALVSGKSAGLDVSDKCLRRINQYLDQAAQDYGEVYSYMPGRPATPSMTAEGLLCRMYLGWPRETPAIDRGIERLLQVAPFEVQTQSYYYWYYATQVLHHAGGQPWEQCNGAMREQLPALQVDFGPDTGSWLPGGRMFDQTGGRLYATCMAIYCLEVYYRHLPLYESPWKTVTDDEEVER